jgi:hypothetical protein
MGQTEIFCRDTHRSADEGAVMVDATTPVRFQRRTGMMVKLSRQPVDLLIGPMVKTITVGQLWEDGFHCSDVLAGTLFDTMAVIRRETGESLLEGLDIEKSDWKGADATAGASEPAGNFPEQGGGGSLEPVVGFLIQRTGVGQGWNCHGRSFLFDREVDDEMAFG